MSNAVSVLNGASFDGAVKISDAGLRGMISVRGDLGSDAMKAAIKTVAGVKVPDVRKTSLNADGGALWMSPDELLVMVDYAKADDAVTALSKALAGEHHMAVNVSDARAIFRLEGQGAREVLAKGAPVDLSSDAFGVGELRRTRIGQLAAAFWMTDAETFELVCFRSVGEFMFDWLSNAAREGGLPEYL